MKAAVLGLLMLVSSVSAWASSDEFTAASKSGQSLKVDVYPQASDEVSILKQTKGAKLTFTSITSWCGMVTLSADAASLQAAHTLFNELVAERSGIPGEVATQQNLILSVIDGELNCRVESVQDFVFNFKGTKLIGKGKPNVSQKTKGQACNDVIAKF
jgi:hypothetical protein